MGTPTSSPVAAGRLVTCEIGASTEPDGARSGRDQMIVIEAEAGLGSGFPALSTAHAWTE